PTPVRPAPALITITPPSADLTVNQTQQFTATVIDDRGNVLTGVALSWWISGAGSMSPTGLFTSAPVTTGEVIDINVSIDGRALGHAFVQVSPPIVLIQPVGLIHAGLPTQLAALVSFHGAAVTNVPVTWSVVPPTAGSVSPGGLFTGRAAGLSACVIAIAGVPPPGNPSCSGPITGGGFIAFVIQP
ncbi:MAG: hypothetical protein M3R57_02715, partial [Chloroflexota bacterium]|nr:hypothetical protein [Chloroflexota bacterium]